MHRLATRTLPRLPFAASTLLLQAPAANASPVLPSFLRSPITRLFSTTTMAPVAPSAPVEIFRADYVPPSNWVTDVDLDFNITPNLTTVQADLTVSTNPASPLFQKGSKDLVLDGDATSVTLTSIKIDGQALTQADYHTTPTQLIVHSSAFADKPTFTLSTVVTTVPEDNTQLSGLYKSGSMYCSQVRVSRSKKERGGRCCSS